MESPNNTNFHGIILVAFVCFACALPMQSKTREQELREQRNRSDQLARDVWQKILETVSTEDRRALIDVSLEVTMDDTLFDFYANEDGLRGKHIVASGGGIRSLDMTCLAFAMSTQGIVDQEWFLDYLYYCRRQLERSASFIADPIRAAGLTDAADLPDRVISTSLALSVTGLAFVLAHEAGHIIHHDSMDRHPEESDSAFFKRLRSNETVADEFACQTLTRMKMPPISNLTGLIGMEILFGHPGHDATRDTHPDNATRMMASVDYVERHFDDYPWKEFGSDPDLVKQSLVGSRKSAAAVASGEALEELRAKYRDLAGLRGRLIKAK